MSQQVFITGSTGFIGRHLIPEVVRRGHEVRALVRSGSEGKLPPGCTAVFGNPLNHETFAGAVRPGCIFVQLVGVPHPSPAKAREFRRIDLVSVRESVAAAGRARCRDFIYLSVAQPSPIMKAYVRVRAEGEAIIRSSGLDATFIRPFYVLGPGRRWPYVLLPAYWLFEAIPQTRETARRLGLVTLHQLVEVLVAAIENPLPGVRIVSVDDIRRGARAIAA